MKPIDDASLLETLDYLVERAERVEKEAQDRYRKAQNQLNHARAVLEYERGRIGTVALNGHGRFAGLSVREAAMKIIDEAHGGEVSAQAIWDIMRRDGFPLSHNNAGRALHAALIGVSAVEKISRSRYRWRSGTGEMDLLRSMHVEPLRSDGK